MVLHPSQACEAGLKAKLDPDIKYRWLYALRSGDYAQTTGALRDTQDRAEGKSQHGFCCLGVLCDVIKDDAAVQGAWDVNGYFVHRELYDDPEAAAAARNHPDKAHDVMEGSLDESILRYIGLDGQESEIEIAPGHWPQVDRILWESLSTPRYDNVTKELTTQVPAGASPAEKKITLARLNDAGVPFPALSRIIEEFL